MWRLAGKIANHIVMAIAALVFADEMFNHDGHDGGRVTIAVLVIFATIVAGWMLKPKGMRLK